MRLATKLEETRGYLRSKPGADVLGFVLGGARRLKHVVRLACYNTGHKTRTHPNN